MIRKNMRIALKEGAKGYTFNGNMKPITVDLSGEIVRVTHGRASWDLGHRLHPPKNLMRVFHRDSENIFLVSRDDVQCRLKWIRHR